jgi:hypothetical protein
MLIANLMISELPSTPRVALSQGPGPCDTFIVTGEKAQKQITPDPAIFKIQLQNNIAWHENYIKKVTTPWLYRFYKERAEARMKKCISP